MVAQPQHTNGELDAAIYSTPVEPITRFDRLLPAKRPLIIKATPKNTTLTRKDTGPDGVLVSFGGKSVQIRDDVDMALAFKLLAVSPLPTKALEPQPQPYKPTGEPLPIDADVVLKSTSEPLPAPMYATGMQKDARGWYLPVFGSPRMWELLLPKLQNQPTFQDFVQVGKCWRVYLEAADGKHSLAASSLRGLVYSFDPFKSVIVVDDDRDESTTRLKTGYDGKTVRE